MEQPPETVPVPAGEKAYDERPKYKSERPVEVLSLDQRMRRVDSYDPARDHDQSIKLR